MALYCQAGARGLEHVLPHFDFGRRCACGRKVYVLTDQGAELRDAPTRERLSALVRFQTAARKPSATRSVWETRLFC